MKIILLTAAGLLALLLVVPVTVAASYAGGEARLRLRVLLFWLEIYPPREETPAHKARREARERRAQEKTARKRKKHPKPPKEKKPPGPGLGADDLPALLEGIRELLPQVGGALGFLCRHFTISRVRLAMLVAGEDAADTALRFGKANAAVYGIYTVLDEIFRVRDVVFTIRPNFLGDGEEWVECSGRLGMAPWVLLWAGLRLAGGAFFTLRPILFPKKEQNNQEKAVQNHAG